MSKLPEPANPQKARSCSVLATPSPLDDRAQHAQETSGMR
jgi:hypothetical protein